MTRNTHKFLLEVIDNTDEFSTANCLIPFTKISGCKNLIESLIKKGDCYFDSPSATIYQIEEYVEYTDFLIKCKVRWRLDVSYLRAAAATISNDLVKKAIRWKSPKRNEFCLFPSSVFESARIETRILER